MSYQVYESALSEPSLRADCPVKLYSVYNLASYSPDRTFHVLGQGAASRLCELLNHPINCGPLCPEHGDVRDTSVVKE